MVEGPCSFSNSPIVPLSKIYTSNFTVLEFSSLGAKRRSAEGRELVSSTAVQEFC